MKSRSALISRMLKKPFRRVSRDETISFFKHPALSNRANRVFFNTLLARNRQRRSALSYEDATTRTRSAFHVRQRLRSAFDRQRRRLARERGERMRFTKAKA